MDVCGIESKHVSVSTEIKRKKISVSVSKGDLPFFFLENYFFGGENAPVPDHKRLMPR